MNWRELHDQLSKEIKQRFPHGDLRPIKDDIPRGAQAWPQFKRFLVRIEKKAQPEVEIALDQFTQTATWPDEISPVARMFICLRLQCARSLILRLMLPVVMAEKPQDLRYLQPPAGTTRSGIMEWVLIYLWEGTGRLDWHSDLRQIWSRKRTEKKP